MGKWISYFLTVFALSFLFVATFWFVSPKENKETSYKSPLPDFLTLAKNEQVRLIDLWQPIIEAVHGSEREMPMSTAKAVLMYDLTTESTLFERASRTRLPMASLTKVMTAIIALENPKSDNKYEVIEADLVGEGTMGLTAGEILTREELLYGLMLHSGNDASEVLARNHPGGRDAFLKAMNDKAVSLGLKDTKFSNPSGLQGDGVQHSTAYDLLVMTRYALDHFPEFKKIVATFQHTIPQTATHKEFFLTNETNLLSTYPGVKGVKTGYTPEAGMCLVSLLEYDGHQIIGILLNSENRRQEMKDLLDFSLNTLNIQPPPFESY